MGNMSDENFKEIQKDIKQILNQTLTNQSANNIPKPILNILEGLNTHFEALDLKKIIAEVMPRLTVAGRQILDDPLPIAGSESTARGDAAARGGEEEPLSGAERGVAERGGRREGSRRREP